MDRIIEAIWIITAFVGKASLWEKMGILMKGFGIIISHMDSECRYLLVGIPMKGNSARARKRPKKAYTDGSTIQSLSSIGEVSMMTA